MPTPEFGERQYELAANVELILGSGQFFAPPTPLEGDIGIDVALAPGHPGIWQLLNVPPPPGIDVGAGKTPGWPTAKAGGAPPFLVSLFVQYKVASYLTRKYAKEWGAHNEDYWRIELMPHQHKRLQQLEQSASPIAPGSRRDADDALRDAPGHRGRTRRSHHDRGGRRHRVGF